MFGPMFSSFIILLCILSAEGQIVPNFQVTRNPSVGTFPWSLDCRPSGSGYSSLSILLYKADITGNFNSIARIYFDINTLKAVLAWENTNLQNRQGASMTGQLSPVSSSYLRVEFTQVLCTDAGMYQCVVSAQATDPVTETGTENITISSPAGKLTLEIQPLDPGFPGSSFETTTMPPVPQFDINTIITLICSGDVGSNKNNIQWCSKMNINFDFSSYPDQPTTTHTSSGGTQSCGGSTARSELSYNITNEDSLTQIRCFIPVENQGYTCNSQDQDSDLVTSLTFSYKVMTNGNGGNTGPVVQSANIGAIVGGLIGALAAIVLIVLLVYFLWYRRRGEGDDYRTKEDDEGRANQPEPYHSAVYSIPDKNRNMGVENKGMDDRHDNRHQYRNDRDRGGQRNRAMDEDDGYDGRTPAGSSV